MAVKTTLISFASKGSATKTRLKSIGARTNMKMEGRGAGGTRPARNAGKKNWSCPSTFLALQV